MSGSERLYTVDEVQYLIELVYGQGQAAAEAAIAARAGAADLSWLLFKRVSYEDWVAAAAAPMEADAAKRAARRGFRYLGGPVDWVSGLPMWTVGPLDEDQAPALAWLGLL